MLDKFRVKICGSHFNFDFKCFQPLPVTRLFFNNVNFAAVMISGKYAVGIALVFDVFFANNRGLASVGFRRSTWPLLFFANSRILAYII